MDPLLAPGPGASLVPLLAEPLTAEAFSPFGQVLQGPPEAAVGGDWINAGTTQRFELLADAQMGLGHGPHQAAAGGGRPVLALYRARASGLPRPLQQMERHRLASQSFVPLGAALRMLVVVAAPGPQDLRAFLSDGRQGVWLAPGTWHHPLLALDAGDFLVLERRAHAPDCDEVALQPPCWLAALA